MTGNKLTIKLTADQQSQIKNATGRTVTELNFDLAAVDLLIEEDLGHEVGGQTTPILKD